MTTKSKLSPLTLIILVAFILFIASFIWKLTHVDNSEEVDVEIITPSKPLQKNNPIILPELAKSTTTSPPDDYEIESIEVKRKKHSANMNKHIMFENGDEVMDVILSLQAQGKDQQAAEYIEFLLKRFPDYEMKQ